MSRLTSPDKFGPIPSLIGKIRNLGRHNTWNKIPLFILPSLALSSLSIYFSLRYKSSYSSYSFIDEKIKEIDIYLMQGQFFMTTAALSLPMLGVRYLINERWNDRNR